MIVCFFLQLAGKRVFPPVAVVSSINDTIDLRTWHRAGAISYCQDFSLSKINSTLAVVLCSVIAVGGTLGNMIIILVIRRTPNLKTICGVLIANLAIADLLVTAIAVPLVILMLTQGVTPVCSVSTSGYASIALSRYSVTASLLTLAAMSIDRCWAICFPFTHKTKMTFSKLKMVLAFVWLASSIYPALEFFFRGQRLFLQPLATSGVVTCYTAIVISGIVTFINVRYRSSKIRNLHQNQNNFQISGDLRERDKQVAKTISLIIVLFSLCWVPVIVISAMFPYRYNMLHYWLGLLGLANSAVNPCIYFYRQRSYRQAFKEMMLPDRISDLSARID